MQSGDMDLGVLDADSHEAAVEQAINDFSEHAGDRPLFLGNLTSIGRLGPSGKKRSDPIPRHLRPERQAYMRRYLREYREKQKRAVKT